MIESQRSLTPPGRVAILARDFQARVVNCSSSGCLLETRARIDVGTIGTLRLTINGRELANDIQIVRCQLIEGAGSIYQVGARFVLTAPFEKGTLRQALAEMSAVKSSPEAVVG